MDQPGYPGFTQEQRNYLSRVFPPVDPRPGDDKDQIMYDSGANSVVRHINAMEEAKRET